MNYIENIYICLAAPLIVAIFCLDSYRRRMMAFLLIGMTMCLLSSYINTFLANVYGLDALIASVEISPTVEEVMKLLPVIFYLLVFEPPKNRMVGNTITVAIGFATFEKVHKGASEARNPRTGATIKVAAHNVAKIKAGSKLKEALN